MCHVHRVQCPEIHLLSPVDPLNRVAFSQSGTLHTRVGVSTRMQEWLIESQELIDFITNTPNQKTQTGAGYGMVELETTDTE